MKYAALSVFAITVVAVLLIAPLAAHHEITAKFDPAKTVTLRGIVTKVDWADPHVHVFVNVTQAGAISNWAIEFESPSDLQKAGWTRDSVKPGDSVTVEGISARNGSRQAWSRSFVLASGNKKIYDVPAATATAPPTNQPTPRWPDNQPRLGPLPGGSGYWAKPSATLLVQAGQTVPANANGLLRNIGDVDKVAPFQRWARDLFELRQRNFLKDDPQFLQCLPPGGPRQFQLPYGVQFIEDREHKRIFVFVGSIDRNWRLIYLDGRAQQGQVRGDSDNPTFYGRAVGKWEGDTLVVDTKGFNERFWFSNGGLPHTDQLHLIERISRPNLNTLRYEVTVDDLGAYTKPWTSTWNLQWIAGEEMPINFCQDNRP
jgi:hypothetical protein